ncbi:uracil-DNA glycosylase [Maritalea mediterranea]|uniref:Type-4 uracil-DNA glycosylase n=1 Tax=Maritalea mediterranea TaxID=2909667 RepID=A0ABS9E4Q0_9HYPH|nr:uracil-DNA glycosylase [Maritalea mediterranea]MCF4097842.1 uracil-DNA glycosylase [Maritalea mediterranea]
MSENTPPPNDNAEKGAFAPVPGASYLDADMASLASLLEWYEAMGVDLAVDDEAVDRFAAPKTGVAAPAAASQTSQNAAPPAVNHGSGPIANPLLQQEETKPAARPQNMAGKAEIEIAAKAAKAADNLEALRDALMHFDACPLKRHADKLVFGEGPADADLMVAGGAPRKQDDLAGLPFQGAEGALLEKILAAIQLDYSQVYRTNILPWRPAGDRRPSPIEHDLCLPFFQRQVGLIKPKFILCLGEQAAHAILNQKGSILRLRGQAHTVEIDGHRAQAFATLNPSHLLNKPAQKALVWHDMLKFKRALQNES